jgi:hypothetical protein
MAQELPYLNSYKNVGLLFDKIAAARQPEAFTHRFMSDTLGLKSATDRPLIPLLRTLGFLDATSKPTSQYGLLKNPTKRGAAIANAIRKAYKPLFDSNENAHTLTGEALRGTIAQVAGSDGNMTSKIAGTLNTLVKLADFTASPENGNEQLEEKETPTPPVDEKPPGVNPPLRSEFHYNVQIHLPDRGTEETYINIFNAFRRVFQ